jgi:hypothetical protein
MDPWVSILKKSKNMFWPRSTVLKNSKDSINILNSWFFQETHSSLNFSENLEPTSILFWSFLKNPQLTENLPIIHKTKHPTKGEKKVPFSIFQNWRLYQNQRAAQHWTKPCSWNHHSHSFLGKPNFMAFAWSSLILELIWQNLQWLGSGKLVVLEAPL